LSLITLVSALILTQLGLLSIMVGAAYWSVKGSGVAALAGLLLILVGARSTMAVWRRLGGQERRPRG
jgi:hypothetical protein